MPETLQRRMLRTIRRHRMIHSGDVVGVCVSGGADSVALLYLLEELTGVLGARLKVVHFNHRLRGAESDAEEHFVADLAAAHDLEFVSGSGDVGRLARENGWNLEDAARRLRYGFFEDSTRAGKATRMAVAHTLDDQAETVLAQLIRGTGPTGLSGVYPVVESVVRPLLAVRRAELRSFLQSRKQTWCEDSSNQDEHRLRARIRRRLMPLLETDFQPVIAGHLGQLADLAREDEVFWRALVEERFHTSVHLENNAWVISLKDLLAPLAIGEPPNAKSIPAGPLTARLIRRILQEAKGDRLGISARHVEDILHLAVEGTSGHGVELPSGIRVSRRFDDLIFSTAPGNARPCAGDSALPTGDFQHRLDLPSGGESHVSIPEIGSRLCLKVIDWPIRQRDTNLPVTVIDWERLCAPVVVRNWRPGDAYRPQGHLRNRKLKQLLREQRVALRDRAGWPVLTSAGALVWARGFPVAGDFVAGASTRKGVWIVEEPL